MWIYNHHPHDACVGHMNNKTSVNDTRSCLYLTSHVFQWYVYKMTSEISIYNRRYMVYTHATACTSRYTERWEWMEIHQRDVLHVLDLHSLPYLSISYIMMHVERMRRNVHTQSVCHAMCIHMCGVCIHTFHSIELKIYRDIYLQTKIDGV